MLELWRSVTKEADKGRGTVLNHLYLLFQYVTPGAGVPPWCIHAQPDHRPWLCVQQLRLVNRQTQVRPNDIFHQSPLCLPWIFVLLEASFSLWYCLWRCVSAPVRVLVCQSQLSSCDDFPFAQSRTTKFEPEMKNSLVKIPLVLFWLTLIFKVNFNLKLKMFPMLSLSTR